MDLELPPGLTLIPNFITEAEEVQLLSSVDKMPWSNLLKRRTQHYGYNYDYKSHDLTVASPIPSYCDFLWPRMKDRTFLPSGKRPDQLIINEYLPGQGIAAHTDAAIFGARIMSLSLRSDCVMIFTSNLGAMTTIILPRRSLLVMQSEARKNYKHEIPARVNDVIGGTKVPRGRRVSLTFRYVKHS